MRLLILALALSLLPLPANAAGWDRYLNARFGYGVSVPPGFVCAPESDNGDGRVCRSANGQGQMSVWGGYTGVVDDKGFAGEAAFELASDKQDGWHITYQASTPDWASYSGTKGASVLYVRIVSGCKETQYATLRLEYPATAINAMRPVVERLVKSLQQQFCP